MFRPASRRRLLGPATALTLTAGVALVGSTSVVGHPSDGRPRPPHPGTSWPTCSSGTGRRWPTSARPCSARRATPRCRSPRRRTRCRARPPTATPVLHPWWEVYQPVDYNLTSRMGNEAQFKSMVQTCRNAGVKVIVDAVINHMTGQGNVSYGGVHYTKYNYPGLYGPTDFHGPSGQCPTAGRQHRRLQQLHPGVQVRAGVAVRPADRGPGRAGRAGRLPEQADCPMGFPASGWTRPSTSGRPT